MPDAIESKAFRKAARANCIKYLGLYIYVRDIPDLRQLNLPMYRSQNPDGAVSQLFSTLVNMNTQIAQIRKGLRMSDASPVPGVSYGEISSMHMAISGDAYFENKTQFTEFEGTLATIGSAYGWEVSDSKELGTSVYRPAKNNFTNSDPVQAAIKGAVMAQASKISDALTVLTANNSIKEGSEAETQYFEARDRMGGSSIFRTAAIQYYSNTPKGVQTQWEKLDDDHMPTLLIDGAPRFQANIPYMPTSISVTPGAYVEDGSGMYPTRCNISISMSNPLGGLFANYTVGTGAGGDPKKEITAIEHPPMFPD